MSILCVSAIRIDTNFSSSRNQKTRKQMEDLMEKYPILDPEIEAVQFKVRVVSCNIIGEIGIWWIS